ARARSALAVGASALAAGRGGERWASADFLRFMQQADNCGETFRIFRLRRLRKPPKQVGQALTNPNAKGCSTRASGPPRAWRTHIAPWFAAFPATLYCAPQAIVPQSERMLLMSQVATEHVLVVPTEVFHRL